MYVCYQISILVVRVYYIVFAEKAEYPDLGIADYICPSPCFPSLTSKVPYLLVVYLKERVPKSESV